MINLKYWDKRNSRIYSTAGYWQGGIDVNCQGHSLINELMGNVSLMQLHILNATGKLVAKNVADWVEVNFMGLSYPDSRIWCNQISAYNADTNATVVSAAASAILSADSRAYGGSQTTESSMAWLMQATADYAAGKSITDIVSTAKHTRGKPMIVGFARPIDRDDERLKPYQNLLKKFELKRGKYLDFALQLSNHLYEKYALSINSGGFSSAVLLDQGFSPADGYKIKAMAVVSGAIACFRSGEMESPNSFLPQKVSDIDYKGIQPRPLP